MPKKAAEETVSMGVRLTLKQRDVLERIARSNGVEVGQLMRWSVDALAEHVGRCRGRLLLPISFGETFTVVRELMRGVVDEPPEGLRRDLPLFGMVPAGSPSDCPQFAESFVAIPNGKTYPKDAFALRVHGDSMIGKGIYDGTIVVVVKDREARHGDVVVALIDGETTLKTLASRNGKYKLLSENPKHRNPVLTDQSAIQAVMIDKL